MRVGGRGKGEGRWEGEDESRWEESEGRWEG